MPENTILGNPDDSHINDNPKVNGENTPPAAPPAAPPAGEFDFSGVVAKDGALAENWRDSLPEELRAEKSLENIKDFRHLAQSYVHAQKAIGANRIAIPGEHATAAEMDEFYNALGRPEKADGYDIKGIQLPKGVELDDTQLKEFREFAHQNGLSQKTFEKMIEYDAARAAKQAETAEQNAKLEYDETVAKLKAEFGPKLNDVILQCNKAMDTFGLKDVLVQHNLLNNYSVIKALVNIGSKISESKLVDGDRSGIDHTPQRRIDEIVNNPDDPFYKKDHPAHDDRVAEVRRLMDAANRAAQA